ncbi:MAG: NPCBM/NEW2 domain-containing protein, partial [Armatimonadia bacterium]
YGLRATGTVEVKCKATEAGLWQRVGAGEWQEAAKGQAVFSASYDQPITLVADKPAWLNLNDTTPPQVVRLTLDGQEVEPEKAKDLGWIEAPKRLTVEIREAENPLDLGSLKVGVNGRPAEAGVVTATAAGDGKGLKVEVDLQRALGEERQTRKVAVEVSVADKSVDRQRMVLPVAFMIRVPQDAGAIYLSDLQAVSSFAHGGLILDRDYIGNPAQIADRVYAKCLTLCPEPSPDGVHGEVVYLLPPDKPGLTLYSDVGISTSASGNGSAAFLVQVGGEAKGPWQTLYTSPTLRGGEEPVTVKVELGRAKYLRLYTTDAGDGIGSDHAVWGGARLK